MKNYILLGIQLLALVFCSIGVAVVDSDILRILDSIMIPINIIAICFHISNIVSNAICKYDDEHYIKYHLNNKDKE